MPGIVKEHPDAFTLLRFVARELSQIEERRVEIHARSCPSCAREIEELRTLDETLTAHRDIIFAGAPPQEELPEDDPFRERPDPSDRFPSEFGFSRESLASLAQAGREGLILKESILAASPPDLEMLLISLDFARVRDRYALGYSLEEAPKRVAEGPVRFRTLSEGSLARLQKESCVSFRDRTALEVTLAEYAYPLVELRARAYLLDGIICNWTGEYGRGQGSFLAAWDDFSRGKGTAVSFAVVELFESQRRAFAGDAATALVLARRSRQTLEEFGFEDHAARARFATGLALTMTGRDEEALAEYRRALESCQSLGLWNIYISVLNEMGLALAKLGRMEEARREYARALRLLGKGGRPALKAYTRNGLAMMLFRSGLYKDAARALSGAVGSFERIGLVSDALTARLYLIESLARSGNLDAARRSLAELEGRIENSVLDLGLFQDFRNQLEGEAPNLDLVGQLRESIEEEIRGVLGRA